MMIEQCFVVLIISSSIVIGCSSSSNDQLHASATTGVGNNLEVGATAEGTRVEAP